MSDLDFLNDWKGAPLSRDDLITAFPANALAATLDQDRTFAPGDPLPPLWHWLFFLDLFKRSDAGYDGHAALGGFLPPVPLPRRMWAGGRLTWNAPLRVGGTLRKTSDVRSVKPKVGKSGPLVFVTVRHQIYEGDTPLLREEHDIVYREVPSPDAPSPSLTRAPSQSDVSQVITPDPVLLFRYSALTFNGHRIHYDQPFATQSEGYDGLIVHGPLLATLMCDLLAQHWPNATLNHFEFRALAPVADTSPFTVHAKDNGDQIDLWVARKDGVMAMTGTAIIS